MTCPRCGNKWDVSKSPCSRCGLLVRLPNNLRSTPRDSALGQNQPGPAAATRTVSDNFPIMPSSADMRSPVESSSSPLQQQEPFQTGVFPDIPTIPTPNPFDEWQRTGTMSIQGTPLSSGRTPPLDSGQASLRAKRLVGNAEKGEMQARHAMRPAMGESVSGSSADLNEHIPENQIRPLEPGALLRNNRYQLRELVNRQEWQTNVYEATWLAQDAQRGGAQVVITELVVPESNSMSTQSMLRTATMALTSVGRHAHVPTLWDAFSDHGRNFFVFELIEGESLYARMLRTGRALSEQEVIEYCAQMVEILELLGQQVPAIVHGLIRPEHIILSSATNRYVLTNFSVILAGGGTQFVSGIDRVRLSSYMSPEFARGMVDTRSDLYSLIASAYHTATGSIPAIIGPLGTVTSAQRLNPNISSPLDQILAKGLRPIAVQRYQRAAELRSDLFAIYSINGSLVERNASVSHPQSASQVVQTQISSQMDAVAQVLPNMLATDFKDDQERKLLLPRPEDLPPIAERNDTQLSLFWLIGILACLTLVVLLSRTIS